jgi:hypothetical protein
MKTFLLLVFGGLCLTAVGFALLLAAMGNSRTLEAAYLGFPLIILGPLLFISGLVVYALRRPTAGELASQKLNDQCTWHFRPLGLAILGICVVLVVIAGNWAEQYIPGIASGRRPLAGYVFALLWLGLLSFRRVRDLLFYTGQCPGRETSGTPGKATPADQGGLKSDSAGEAGSA